MLRRIESLLPVSLRGVTPAIVAGCPTPELAWVKPAEIYVEAEYQRNLSERSIWMIRKIVAGWRWAHVKPVICARVGDKLMALDGQHTAIAAATLGIGTIPALIVEAPTVKERAAAFIGQNSDRINLTAAHMHFAQLAAGEEMAVAVDQACAKAGVTILRQSRGQSACKVGETYAVTILHRLVGRHGVNFLARVLRILVDAKRAPIGAVEIAAVSILLREAPYVGAFEPFNLVTIIRSAPLDRWLAMAAKKIADGTKRRIALADVLFTRARRGGL